MKMIRILAVAATMALPSPVLAADWLQGVYLNNDKDSSMDEVIFCADGKAYAGMGHRTYAINSENGQKVLTLSSNGTFTFTVSDDENTLLPADKFTKDWFTTTSLSKDPKRTDTCNW
jgi:hypothetical protein